MAQCYMSMLKNKKYVQIVMVRVERVLKNVKIVREMDMLLRWFNWVQECIVNPNNYVIIAMDRVKFLKKINSVKDARVTKLLKLRKRLRYLLESVFQIKEKL